MINLSELMGESDCPVSFSIEKTCSERPYQPKPGDPWWPRPTKRLEVGSTIPLTVQWPAPDNWLARVAERWAGLLYKMGIHWPWYWGRWRMDALQTKAEVVQDNEAGLRLRVTPGVLTKGRKGTLAQIEGLDD